MSFTDLLRKARSGRTALLHKFLTAYDPNSDRVYAFVEGGADQAFYRVHIQGYVRSQSAIYIYDCEGKRNVYDLYSTVIAKYPACRRVLFFVDKDVDDIVGQAWPLDPRVFTTEVYSVENYCVCRAAVERYFQNFVKVRRSEYDLETIKARLEIQMSKFHKLMLPVMAWIVAARRAGLRVVLTDVNLDELFTMRESSISRRPRRRAAVYLNRVTQVNRANVSWSQVRSVCGELQRFSGKSYVRGKFEAWFFVKFVRSAVEEINHAARAIGGSASQIVPLNEACLVQLLSEAVATPPQLDTFLRFHLGPTQVPLDLNTERNRQSLIGALRSFLSR